MYNICLPQAHECSETNLDDVLQISDIFVNVSKGELAKAGDLKKSFGKMGNEEIVKEVKNFHLFQTGKS